MGTQMAYVCLSTHTHTGDDIDFLDEEGFDNDYDEHSDEWKEENTERQGDPKELSKADRQGGVVAGATPSTASQPGAQGAT